MKWEPAQYGWSETLKLADGRVRLRVAMSTHERDTPNKFTGSVFVEAKSKEFDTIEEAKRSAIAIARKRLKQALTELDEMESRSETNDTNNTIQEATPGRGNADEG